jgi:hypothetical protein
MEKIRNGVDVGTLMSSSNNVLSKESQYASAMVNEGFKELSKHFFSQNNHLSGAFGDDDDDILIVNNGTGDDYEFEDEDEEEFSAFEEDSSSRRRDRSNSLTHGLSKVNQKGPAYNSLTASSFKQFQQIQTAKLESQIQSLEEDLIHNNKFVSPAHSLSEMSHEPIKNPNLQFQKKEDKKSSSESNLTNHRIDQSPVYTALPKTARDKLQRTNSLDQRFSRSTSSSGTKLNGLVNQYKPKEDPPIRTRQGLVLYSFEPENPGELAVEADDMIEVITVKGEWVECLTEDRRHGWVPFNYVQIQDDSI